jgi:hypothetical protein
MTKAKNNVITAAETARRCGAHPGIQASCPACKATTRMTPDHVRGSEGKLVWCCGNCNGMWAASQVEEATATIAGGKISLPTTITQI